MDISEGAPAQEPDEAVESQLRRLLEMVEKITEAAHSDAVRASEATAAAVARAELAEQRVAELTEQVQTMAESSAAIREVVREYALECAQLQQAAVGIARRALSLVGPMSAESGERRLSVVSADPELPATTDTDVIDIVNQRDLATLDHPSRWARLGRRRLEPSAS